MHKIPLARPAPVFSCLALACLLLACLALGSCLPTVQNREAMKMDGYVGGPISAVVQDMGTPTLSHKQEDGGWIYIWRGCRVEFDWYGRDRSRYCEITTRSDGQGRMTDWNWWGNECPLEGVSSGCGGLLWWQP